MCKQNIDAKELGEQRELLFKPVGEPGTGYMRYSAAMFFHMRGEISVDLLEMYRRCCKFDHEDPIAVARYNGIDETVDHLKL